MLTMNERNMLCSGHQLSDTVNGQPVQNHLHPELCIPTGTTSSFTPSSINQVFPPSGDVRNFDLHHLPEHLNGHASYGVSHYNQYSHPATNLELGVPTSSNFYNPHLNQPSGGSVFPVPLNHGFMDQLPSSSNYRSNAVPFSEHGRNHFSTDAVRGFCKRKNADGMPGNVQHFGSCAGPSSSSATPPNVGCHFDSGGTAMDAPHALADYRSNNAPLPLEVGSGLTARHQSATAGLHMDSAMVHNYNYLFQGNYGGRSFQPSSCSWLDQQVMNSGGPLPWSAPPMLPYYHGSNAHGSSSDMGNAGLPGYSEVSSSHGSANFSHQAMFQQRHNLHPSQIVQGTRGYGVACYPPFVPAPSRVLTGDSMPHDSSRLSQESGEPAGRLTGIRIYRSHGRGLLPDATSRRRDLPRLRNLPADRVAILEFPSFYEVDDDVDHFIDHHRDMRLDIDDMSYEELLALSERIGTVSTGLSEEDIACHLRTRFYSSTAATINLEELPCIDQNNDSCIICQDEYKDSDKLGTLECGHEYHVECLKKWLLVKNVCPICKSSALTVERKDW